MDDIFTKIIDRCLKGQELYETFSDETKKILESHRKMINHTCSLCHGVGECLSGGHPMERASFVECGKCYGTGVERSVEILDIDKPEVLIALLNEPNGREWFLNGCLN